MREIKTKNGVVVVEGVSGRHAAANYIWLDKDAVNKRGVSKRTEQLTRAVNLDYDKDDNLIGIEILV